jgi:hypothetical protein
VSFRSGRCSCKDNIKINLTEIEGRGLDTYRVGWGNVAGSCEQDNEISVSIKVGNVSTGWAISGFSRGT